MKEIEGGKTISATCREYGISDETVYRWRSKYGGMETSDVRKLHVLEDENAKLKRIVADQALDIAALKELAQGNW